LRNAPDKSPAATAGLAFTAVNISSKIVAGAVIRLADGVF
jgi:hypothetical protein